MVFRDQGFWWFGSGLVAYGRAEQNGNCVCGSYMGGCQNHCPFLDPYYNTAPNI